MKYISFSHLYQSFLLQNILISQRIRKKTGDKNAIEALDKIYKEMIEKMNGKKILIDYIKKRNKTEEEGEEANKVNVNNYDKINNTCNH